MKNAKFSVLLRRPGYVTDDPDDTFYTFVKAVDTRGAVKRARTKAARIDRVEGCTTPRPLDYSVLLVISGHHMGLETGDD